jgi:predicted  nucleic acid-binding Zn-ribbon protein
MADGPRRYPLEAARKVRGHVVDEQEAALARAVSALEAARAGVEAAREALRAHVAMIRGEEAAIARREDRGGPAADLSRGEAFRARRQREKASLAEAIRVAEAARAAAADAVSGARERLAGAQADKEVVDRHHDRFRTSEQKSREAREESEAEDLAAARRHRSD